MNDLYKFVDIIKEHENSDAYVENMYHPDDRISEALNSVYGLISYIKTDISNDTVDMELVGNILSVLESIKEKLES